MKRTLSFKLFRIYLRWWLHIHLSYSEQQSKPDSSSYRVGMNEANERTASIAVWLARNHPYKRDLKSESRIVCSQYRYILYIPFYVLLRFRSVFTKKFSLVQWEIIAVVRSSYVHSSTAVLQFSSQKLGTRK
jgi:hypothetical protein